MALLAAWASPRFGQSRAVRERVVAVLTFAWSNVQSQALIPDRLFHMCKMPVDFFFRQGLGKIARRHFFCLQELDKFSSNRLFHGRYSMLFL